MNINNVIKIRMFQLSKKYNISLVELTTVKANKLNKAYLFNYKSIRKNGKNIKKTFYNKRDLASWLICLE